MKAFSRRHAMHGATALTTALLSGCSKPALPRDPIPETAPNSTVFPFLSDHIPLWPKQPPGGGGPHGPLHLAHYGELTNIAEPFLSVHRPTKPNGAAIIVAGGGGYRYIQITKEEIPPARWLNSLGITVFELVYRLPREGWNAGSAAPFQDAQRAIRLIRTYAAAFSIDPERIGGLGFSAGGHLLGMCALRPDWQSYAPIDEIDRASAHLALAILAYPVVTLLPPYQNTGTRRSLVGLNPTLEESRKWSLQTYVRPGAPPFFLVHAANDRIASPANTAILEAACRKNGVPVARHLFPAGGHGFGLGRPGMACAIWPRMAERWLRGLGFTT